MTYIMACVEAAHYNSVYTSVVCIFTAIILIQSDTFDCGIFIVLTTMVSNWNVSVDFFQQLDICKGSEWITTYKDKWEWWRARKWTARLKKMSFIMDSINTPLASSKAAELSIQTVAVVIPCWMTLKDTFRVVEWNNQRALECEVNAPQISHWSSSKWAGRTQKEAGNNVRET